jgi:hypothetical protein
MRGLLARSEEWKAHHTGGPPPNRKRPESSDGNQRTVSLHPGQNETNPDPKPYPHFSSLFSPLETEKGAAARPATAAARLASSPERACIDARASVELAIQARVDE